MTESGTFIDGITIEGTTYREFTLEEQKFRHTLSVLHSTDGTRAANDPVMFSGAILAARLLIPVDSGITEEQGKDLTAEEKEKLDTTLKKIPRYAQLTAENIMDLSAEDGEVLTTASIRLELRRKSFRDAAGAASQGANGTTEAGAGLADDQRDDGSRGPGTPAGT